MHLLESKLAPEQNYRSTLQGILAALATTAQATGMFLTEEDRQRFADECRDGLVSLMITAAASFQSEAEETIQ